MLVLYICYLGIEMFNEKFKIYFCMDVDVKDEDK